jgi:hypothetical protein
MARLVDAGHRCFPTFLQISASAVCLLPPVATHPDGLLPASTRAIRGAVAVRTRKMDKSELIMAPDMTA